MKKNNGSRQESCWMLQTKRADFGALAKRFHISPVTARIIRNRGIVGEEAVENISTERFRICTILIF